MIDQEKLTEIAQRYQRATPVDLEKNSVIVTRESNKLVNLLNKAKDQQLNINDVAQIMTISSIIISTQQKMIEELHNTYLEDSKIVHELVQFIVGPLDTYEQKATTLPN